MYKYILTPFLIAISTPLSAKIYDGLEVKGDHRVLSLLVEEIEDNFESLTKEDVEKALKIKMLTYDPNRKVGNRYPAGYTPDFIYVKVSASDIKTDGGNAIGTSFHVSIQLVKFTAFYLGDSKLMGDSYIPFQGNYTVHGVTTKVNFLESIKSLMDDFILDYLESNTKNEAPKREYKSRFIRPTPLAPINRN